MVDKLIIRNIEKDINKKYHIESEFIKEIIGGWKNRKWKASSDVGNIVIKELSSKRYSKSRIEEVEKALKIQSKISNDIAPNILEVKGNVIQKYGDFNYMVMEHVNGSHKNIDTINYDDLFNLGVAIGEVHNVDYCKVYSDDLVVNDHYSCLFEHVEKIEMNNIKNNEFSMVFKEIEEIIKSISRDFFGNMKVGFTHSDCSKDNILFAEDSVKIIDFDRGRVGYQLQDIGRIIMTLMFNGESIDRDKLDKFIYGYNQVNELSYEDVIKSLKLVWIVESPWWMEENLFNKDIKDKLVEFREQLIWLTYNYDDLSDKIN